MVRTLIFIAVFAVGFFAGGLFPSFSNQYHQRLQAQFDQVNIDLEPFQQIADSYHGGSMEALVQHHLASPDPTFHAEGEAIQAMLSSQSRLAEAKAAANAPYTDQAIYIYRNLDPQVSQAVFDTYSPALVTTENAITFALTIATIILALFWALWLTTRLVLKRLLSARRT